MTTAPVKIRIKCHLGSEIRVQTHLHDESFDVFSSKISVEYGLDRETQPVLLYRDEEGSIITIRTDNDLKEAFSMVIEGVITSLHIYVNEYVPDVVAPSPSPSQSSIRPRSASGGSSNAFAVSIFNHNVSPHGPARSRTNSESRVVVMRRSKSDGDKDRPRSGSFAPQPVDSDDDKQSTPTTQHSTTSLSTFFLQQQREQLEQLRLIEASQRSFHKPADESDDDEGEVHPHFNGASPQYRAGKFEQDTENSITDSAISDEPKPHKTLYDLLDSGGQDIDGEWSKSPTMTKPLRWTRGTNIGSGSFGQVFTGLNVDTGEIFAVKQILLPTNDDESMRKELERIQKEIDLLRALKHENVVRYYGTEIKDGHLNIFLEYLPGGSIASMISKFGPFAEDTIRVYVRQILNGLNFLHSKGIVHRDIKGGNILIDSNGIAKLADFGASKVLNDILYGPTHNTTEANSFKGTCYFMAPEVIRQTGHGRKADVWSLGCTIVEMATGKPPYAGTPAVTAIFKIASATEPPPIPSVLSDLAKDFLSKCFVLDPKHRASVATLLNHPFLSCDIRLESTPTRVRGGSGTLIEKPAVGSVTGEFVPDFE